MKVCNTESVSKLRNIIFTKTNTNAFPSVFAVILIAFHEIIIGEKKKISDYGGVKAALNNLSSRIETGRKATSPEERRKNIDTIKGLIGGSFVKAKLAKQIYTDHTTIDIEGIIRRSEIELANYELKQGILSLKDGSGTEDGETIDKVIKTICAIANIGPKSTGKIVIGVTDKKADADKIRKLDGIEPKKIGKRYVVGVNREAKRLKVSVEVYFSRWKDRIRKSSLTDKLRDAVLSNMDFNSFYGLGIIVITIPSQTDLSYVGEELYWRDGDATALAKSAKQVASIASRFAKGS